MVTSLWEKCSLSTVLVFILVHRDRVLIRDTSSYNNRLRIANTLVIYIFLSGPVIRSGNVDKKGWCKVIWSDGDCHTHAELVDGRRLKSDKIDDLKPDQWAIVDSVQEERYVLMLYLRLMTILSISVLQWK